MSPLTLTVNTITGATVTAASSDGRVFTLPLECVYGTPKPGQELRLIAAAPGSEDLGRTAFAHALLTELLGPTTHP